MDFSFFEFFFKFSFFLDFLLRNEVFRQQHVCSNLLPPGQAPDTEAARGFIDEYDPSTIPQMSGFDKPHQVILACWPSFGYC